MKTILFQGDSITDAGRRRQQLMPGLRNRLGSGYVAEIAERLQAERETAVPTILNRGISGDQVVDLAARWQTDCLDLQPDLLSILVGVNDTWRALQPNNGYSGETFTAVYHQILTDTRTALPNVRLVLCEPFALVCGNVTEAWLPELQARQQTVRQLADQFQATFVPFQAKLDEAAQETPPQKLLNDGVHPTDLGHRLLAEWWLTAVGLN